MERPRPPVAFSPSIGFSWCAELLLQTPLPFVTFIHHRFILRPNCSVSVVFMCIIALHSSNKGNAGRYYSDSHCDGRQRSVFREAICERSTSTRYKRYMYMLLAMHDLCYHFPSKKGKSNHETPPRLNLWYGPGFSSSGCEHNNPSTTLTSQRSNVNLQCNARHQIHSLLKQPAPKLVSPSHIPQGLYTNHYQAPSPTLSICGSQLAA